MRHASHLFNVLAAGSLPRLQHRVPEAIEYDPMARQEGGYGQVPGTISRLRLSVWFNVVLFTLLVIAVRSVYLQLWRGTYYHLLAEGNRVRILEVPARRGIMADRYGRPLVAHEPNLQLLFTPVDLPKSPAERRALAGELSGLLGRPVQEVLDRLAAATGGSYQPQLLQEQLSHQQAVRAATLQVRWTSLRLQVATSRRYLTAKVPSLSHVLGYLGKLAPEELSTRRDQGYALTDTIGKSGLELALEPVLRGRKGREQIEVDALGRRKELIAYEPPVSGSDVTLTIDLDMQAQLERSLSQTMAKAGKRRGVAVVLDPANGEVLAIVSWPSFDSNTFARGITAGELSVLAADPERPLFNRAIQGTYPSGSTVKPLVAAAALQAGIITPRTVIWSTGGVRVNQWFFPDWKSGGHGPTNLTAALAESVNTYFYYLAGGYEDFTGLGIERLTGHLRQAGLGQATGIELSGEAAGLVPGPAWKLKASGEPWYIGDTYHLGIGQGDLLVTPLQVARFTAMVANGGRLPQPHLTRRVTGADGTVQPLPSYVLAPAAFDAAHLAAVRNGLRQAVRTGSARALNDLPVSVAGKTGTAQWSSTSDHHAWFTGYAPAEQPEIVITVLVEEGGEGSATAVPVVRDFLLWWLGTRG